MTCPKEPVQVVAEIGCNHMGQMNLAKDLIRAAAKSGAHIAKFQKRTNRELLSPAVYNAPHPVADNSYGDTYGAHREFLEFDASQHRELMAYAKEQGIIYSTSVWDLTSAQQMSALKPKLLKIPSATNQNYQLQDYLCRNYEGEIHVSTGMSTSREITDLIEFYIKKGRGEDLVVYSCTSGYPVAYADVCLMEIQRLMERFGDKVKGIGFSGHHQGIATDMAALTIGRMMQNEGLGCFTHVERHFTLDCTWKGTDHAASLEPEALRKLCRDLKNVDDALSFKAQEVLPVERVQRDKLKWVDPRHALQAAG